MTSAEMIKKRKLPELGRLAFRPIHGPLTHAA